MKEVEEGATHKLPVDLQKALIASPEALNTWRRITPLARNEWICWTISVKKKSTRENHVKRAVMELALGKRRPCCWIGCIHRTDKPLSSSVKWILTNKS